MSSFDEVFAAVKEYCKERLVLATYNLFIDGIEPVSFEGSVATLSVRSDFVKGIVETRYKDLLREAFKELLGFDIDVELTIPAPVEQAPAEVPGGGNYEFTFENFIVGSHQQVRPRGRAWPLRRTHPALITRCSSTAVPAWAKRTCSYAIQFEIA